MSAYNFGKMTGILTGVVIGLVVLVVIFVICNKNRKLKTEYDERQQILRGNGYRFGFYAMTVWAGIQILLAAMDIELPLQPVTQAFSCIFVGVLADVLYCIFHDAYWGLNNNRKRYMIAFLIIAALNFAIAFGAYKSGNLIVDGKLGAVGTNLLCAILFLLTGVALIIQQIREKSPEKE